MNLADGIFASAAPDRIAGVEGGEILTYSGLESASRGLRNRLGEAGLRAGRTAAVQMPNSLESLAAYLAVMRLGADLLLLDPSLKPAEAEEFCRIAEVSILLRREDSGSTAGPRSWTVPRIGELLSTESPEPLGDAQGASAGEGSSFLLLSSGTTGRSKIVRRTGAQTEAAVRIFEQAVPCRPSDRVLAAMPFCHSFGFLYTLLVTLRAGAALHFGTFSPRTTARSVEQDRLTVLPATPFMFRMLAETSFDPVPSFASVRLAISAGTGLPPSVSRAFQDKFGVGILQSYGSTESGPAALGRPEDRVDEPGWVGRPYPGVQLDFQEPGIPGSRGAPVLVRSPGLAAGYVGDPLTTQSVFRGNAVLIGDLGHVDESGNLFVLGRERPMLNVGGKKVSPAEIESCLKSHPGVSDAVVSGVPAPDGGDRIKAVLAADPALEIKDLQAFVSQRLADFKVPREFEFVGADRRTALGKVRHSPAPASAAPQSPALRDLLGEAGDRAIENLLRHPREAREVESAFRSLLGELPAGQLESIARQAVIRQVKNQVLRNLGGSGRLGEILPLIRFHGAEVLAEMHRRGEPAILVFSHSGPRCGFLAGMNALGLPVTTLRHLRTDRARSESALTPERWSARKGSSEMMLFLKHAADRLKQGAFVSLAIDGHLGDARVPIPCLGRVMKFPRGPQILHRITKAAVIPLSVAWSPGDEFIDFTVHLPLVGSLADPDPGAQEERWLLKRIVRWLEDLIRSDPGQLRVNHLPRWLAAPRVGSAHDSEDSRIHRIEAGGFRAGP